MFKSIVTCAPVGLDVLVVLAVEGAGGRDLRRGRDRVVGQAHYLAFITEARVSGEIMSNYMIIY